MAPMRAHLLIPVLFLLASSQLASPSSILLAASASPSTGFKRITTDQPDLVPVARSQPLGRTSFKSSHGRRRRSYGGHHSHAGFGSSNTIETGVSASSSLTAVTSAMPTADSAFVAANTTAVASSDTESYTGAVTALAENHVSRKSTTIASSSTVAASSGITAASSGTAAASSGTEAGSAGTSATSAGTVVASPVTAAASSVTAAASPVADSPTATGGDSPSTTTANVVPVATSTQAVDGSTLVLVPVQPNSSDVLALTSDVYRHRAQMGVNLGGWFVAEEWMDIAYFQCATSNSAEINIAEGCSQEWMENHWDTWITEQDFALMASAGINTARLPVGYWSVGADNCNCDDSQFWPYMAKYDNSWERVLRAIGWAAEYGIGILLDMHGVEGSQNGLAHSGNNSGVVDFPKSTVYQAHTIEVFKYMASTIVGLDNVVGFELVNEPFPSPLDTYTAFYDAAMTAMRPILGDDFPFYMFTDTNNWNTWMKEQSGFLVSDYHNYYLYGSLPNDDLVQVEEYITTTTTDYLQAWAPNLIIGEWTCAPGSVHTGTAADVEAYCAAQMALTLSTEIAGSYYWNWNMAGSSCNGWSFQDQAGISGRCSGTQNLQPLNGASTFSPGSDIATLSGNSNAIVSSTALVASRSSVGKRELYRREHGHHTDTWDHRCRVAQLFAASNSKLGFAAQWIKSKGRDNSHEIDDAGYLSHFKEGLKACALR